MILVDKKHDAELIALAPSIRHHMNEWQIVNINILKDSSLQQQEVIERLLRNYEKYEGLIYPVSVAKIVMLARLGLVHSYAYMKTEIEQQLPKYCCRVMMRKMNAAGLKQIQLDLMERDDGIVFEEDMYHQRLERKQNIILVADDDTFIRSSMKKLLGASGTLVEAAGGMEVMSCYLKYNPDIVFLDIHMPGKNGLELVREIIKMDTDAFIIILSADSSAGNVMKALDEGAVGFLSKPPAKHKVQEYISQCITIR